MPLDPGSIPGSSTKKVLFKATNWVRAATTSIGVGWIMPGVSGFNRHDTATSATRRRGLHDPSPSCLGARRGGGDGGHHSRRGPWPAADEVSDQHSHGQAGLRALRSAQRRRQFSAWAALSSTARAVPERCGGLVWRRPGPCESRARESRARESYEPHKSYEPCAAYEPREPDEFCDPNQFCDPNDLNESDEPAGSEERRLTTPHFSPPAAWLVAPSKTSADRRPSGRVKLMLPA